MTSFAAKHGVWFGCRGERGYQEVVSTVHVTL